MQPDTAVKVIKSTVTASGLTTTEAVSALATHKAFKELKRSTLRGYAKQAFVKLSESGRFTIEKVGSRNKLVMLDNLHNRLLFEASEMRKDGVNRREIVTLLGQDFGLARGEVRQYLKCSN